MHSRRKIQFLLAGLLLAAVAWGVANLFALRFSAGDVYPPYSSKRADPLGLGVLYESLAALPDLQVERNFRPWAQLHADAATTVLVAGETRDAMLSFGGDPHDERRRLAAQGGRVVLGAFDDGIGHGSETQADGATNASETCRDPGPEAPRTNAVARCVRCGKEDAVQSPEFRVRRSAPEPDQPHPVATLARGMQGAPLPAVLPWQGELRFEGLSNGWQSVYERDGEAVVIARKLGRGSLVCLADSYLLSNEAMLRDCQPQLLSWLIDDGRRVVFDESHLGLASRPSLGVLVRRYRLQGALLGLLALAALFLWRESLPLVPFGDAARAGAAAMVQGRDSQTGLVNLLRRSVTPEEVIARCVELWEQAGVQTGGGRADAVRRALETEGAAGEKSRAARDPVGMYRAIGAIVKERK